MNTKHTAGEWTTGITASGPDNCKRAMVYSEFPYDMQETICVVSGLNGTEPGETAKANAKLIAAAPDLLEALKLLNNFCVFIPKQIFAPAIQKDLDALTENAKAAISKATL